MFLVLRRQTSLAQKHKSRALFEDGALKSGDTVLVQGAGGMSIFAFGGQQQDFIRAIDTTRLRPVIDRHFSLEYIVPAFQYQGIGQHFGKIVRDI